MIMCAIYGVCRISHKLLPQIHEDNETPNHIGIKFNTIIEAYREMTCKQKSGGINTLMPSGGAHRNMTWILIDVPIDVEKDERANIIDFYNKVFLPKMHYNLKALRHVSLEERNIGPCLTPVLNKSNLDALLTPGG